LRKEQIILARTIQRTQEPRHTRTCVGLSVYRLYSKVAKIRRANNKGCL
jgi:hypothetical protein